MTCLPPRLFLLLTFFAGGLAMSVPHPRPGSRRQPHHLHIPDRPVNATDLDGNQCYSNPNFTRYCQPIMKARSARWTVAATVCSPWPRRAQGCATYGLVDGKRAGGSKSVSGGRGIGGGVQIGFSGQPSPKKTSRKTVSFWASRGVRGGYISHNSDGSVGVGWTFGTGFGWSVGR